MSTDEVRALLGAWAIDAVDDVERQAVERALAEDPDLAREAAELREAVAQLAEAERTPVPAALRERVLLEVAAVDPRGSDHAGARQSQSEYRRTRGLRQGRRVTLRRLAVAAALIVAVGIPSGLAWQERQRADRLDAQLEVVIDSLVDAQAQVTQADVAGGGSAALIDDGSRVIFAAAGLPELTDQDYQLWMIVDSEPAPADVLDLHDGTATAEMANVPAGASVAVTVEPPGGSQVPSSEPVVVLARS
ncbi:anti-sigma factor domain-containing protein [Ruania halotolerans]|uniref:anti-sigma factor n=1 Tax=Ruania halotolerans TaxID=2897773 RepID=UPI001E2F77DF|nr:anti-sigma factor [Ruania halotolerans]UFU06823.1 anti-sigma factor [Ruania halotolerans]